MKVIFDDIEKENKVYGTYLHHKFESILNIQLIDEDEALTIKSMMTKSKKSRRNTNDNKSTYTNSISRH